MQRQQAARNASRFQPSSQIGQCGSRCVIPTSFLELRMNTHTIGPNLRSPCPKAHPQGHKKIPPSLYREGGHPPNHCLATTTIISLFPSTKKPFPNPKTRKHSPPYIREGRDQCPLLCLKKGALEISILIANITIIPLSPPTKKPPLPRPQKYPPPIQREGTKKGDKVSRYNYQSPSYLSSLTTSTIPHTETPAQSTCQSHHRNHHPRSNPSKTKGLPFAPTKHPYSTQTSPSSLPFGSPKPLPTIPPLT
jgi:hypothetical protein